MQAPEVASERQQDAHLPSPPEHSERQEFILSPSDFRKILIKRRWVILACFLLGVIVAAIITTFTVPVYESVARVDINPSQSTNIGISDLMENKIGADSFQPPAHPGPHSAERLGHLRGHRIAKSLYQEAVFRGLQEVPPTFRENR